jgi:hypothetical protein
MLGAWLAAKAETNGIGDSSADWRKSYSPNLEKANVAAAAVGLQHKTLAVPAIMQFGVQHG